MSDVEISLPRPSRAAWIFLSLVGLIMALFGVAVLVADFSALMQGEPMMGAFVCLGAGLFLFGFGLLFVTGRERPARMHVSPKTITLSDRSGDRVAVPWTELERVATFPAQGDNQGWVITLNKRDGGVLELLGTRTREEADRIVADIERARGEEPETSPPTPPEAHLEHIAGVTAVRQGDALELSWNATVPARQLVFFGPVVGMALIIFGAHRDQGGVGTFLAMAFMGLITGLLVASTLRVLGVRQRIRLNAREVMVERHRRGKLVEQQSVPTFSLVTVDYTHRLNVIGAQLNLRTGEARDNRASALNGISEGEERVNPVEIAKAIGALMKQGVQVPMGALSLPAKIAVDLALSAEVARRTGKSSAAV